MRLSLLILLLGISFSGQAQDWTTFNCNDLPPGLNCEGFFDNLSDTINPIDDPHLFNIDSTNPNNDWVFGHSHKEAFDSVSTFRGWITDSVQAYSPNSKSHFEVLIVDTTGLGPMTWVGFEHKFELDSATEGCYVEYSCDRENWRNLEPFNPPYPPSHIELVNYPPYVTQSSTIHDSVSVFHHATDNWFWSYFQIQWVGTLIQNDPNERSTADCSEFFDSLYVRFTFESDSIESNKAGWMIREVVIGQGNYQLWNVPELSNSQLRFLPNPSTGTFRLQLEPAAGKLERVAVFDLSGRKVHDEPFLNMDINLSHLRDGHYILQGLTDKGVIRKQLIIQK